MFTGIIEKVGSIDRITPRSGGKDLLIDLGHLADDAKLGDSIAVSGACLTIDSLHGSKATFYISGETLKKTTAGSWQAGTPVNLERALALGDRLGGHLVSGHIDGVGQVAERRREGEGETITIILPESGSVKVVEKGSLAIDGVSLTTWDCRGRRASIAVVPHTLAQTTLTELRPGSRVNLEQDLIGRWVQTMAEEQR